MNLQACKKICGQCPFKKSSLKGWLGDLTVEQTLEVQQYEGLFPCHMKRKGSTEDIVDKTISGEIPICRGFLISANKSYKLFGSNPETGQSLRKLQQSFVSSPSELDSVLDRQEFLLHHS